MMAHLPFPLRATKVRRLSGEALEAYHKLAVERSFLRASLAGADERTLARALRKFDFAGYGQIDRRGFELAVREAGCEVDGRAFGDIDVQRVGRADAEVLVALCRYWRATLRVAPDDDDDDDDEASEDSASLESVRRACERLDAGSRGAVPREDLLRAIAHAKASPFDLEARFPRTEDGLYAYAGTAGAAWRAGAEIWPSVRGQIGDIFDAPTLFEAFRGAGLRLNPTDRAALWQKLSTRPTCGRATADAAFGLPRLETPVRVEAPLAPPFADDTPADPPPRRRALRPTTASASDESPGWPRPDDRIDKTRSAPAVVVTPPYWTCDVAVPARDAPAPTPCPFFRGEINDPPPPDDPPLARRLRAAATRADERARRSAISLVSRAGLARGQLQSLAQHFAIPLSRGDLEELRRWIGDRDPDDVLRALGFFEPPKEEDEENYASSTPIAQEEEEEDDDDDPPSPQSPPPLPTPLDDDPQHSPPTPERRDTHSTTIKPPLAHPDPPPDTDDAWRATLGRKIAAAPAIATTKKGTAYARLRHAFRRHARRCGPLLMTARGADEIGDATIVSAKDDVARVLRELGVDLNPHELRVLLADTKDEGAVVRIQPIVAHLVHLANHHPASSY